MMTDRAIVGNGMDTREGLHKRPKSPPPSPDDQPCDLRLITSATIKELVAAATGTSSSSSSSTIPSTQSTSLSSLPTLTVTGVGSSVGMTAGAIVQNLVAPNYANIVAAVAAAAKSPTSRFPTSQSTSGPPTNQPPSLTSSQAGAVNASNTTLSSVQTCGPHQASLHTGKFCSPIGLESLQQVINVNLPLTSAIPTTVSTACVTSPLLSLPINSGSSGSSTASNLAGTGSSSGATGTGGWGAFTCPRCGNSYARPHSLNRHIRFECGVEPKFECPICHKKSKHKHNLVLHMRTHQNR